MCVNTCTYHMMWVLCTCKFLVYFTHELFPPFKLIRISWGIFMLYPLNDHYLSIYLSLHTYIVLYSYENYFLHVYIIKLCIMYCPTVVLHVHACTHVSNAYRIISHGNIVYFVLFKRGGDRWSCVIFIKFVPKISCNVYMQKWSDLLLHVYLHVHT